MRFLNSIYVAVLILVLTMGLGSYVDIRNDEIRMRHLEINTGLERMLRLNQELTGMLVMSVLEQNTLRTASYDTVNANLEATIKTVGVLTKQQNLSEEMSALSEDHHKLHLVEEEVLKLMRLDQWKEARKILFDDSYVLARKMYEINSETAVGALTGELAATARHFDQIRTVALGVRVAALLLLLWVGAMFSRRLRKELAEQARLREEIIASNRVLEERVSNRTAELEAANRQLEALSATDALTSLANRRKFDAAWDTEWQRALRQGAPLAIALMDVDNFKAYNDYYGHQAGDVCLKRLADVLNTSAQRSGEMAARYGGEEFVVILPGLSGLEACAVAERIRSAMQSQAVSHARATAAEVVTVSIGVASRVPKQGESSSDLIKEADAAMYQAKHQGRNRVVLAA